MRSANNNENIIVKKVTDGLLINFKKNEVFIEDPNKKRIIPDIEIELWSLKRNKMQRTFSNRKS